MEPATEAPLFDRLSRLMAAWAAKDLDTTLSFMAEDIVWHYAAPGAAPLKGKAAARKLLGRFLGEMHAVAWRVTHHAETADRLFVEGVDAYRTSDGAEVALPYAGVLDFKDGLIVGWRDYVDLGVLAEQKAGKRTPPHVQTLTARPAG